MGEEFWIIIAATAASALALVAKLCFKSKCSKISTPCFTIERDIEAEEKQLERSESNFHIPTRA